MTTIESLQRQIVELTTERDGLRVGIGSVLSFFAELPLTPSKMLVVAWDGKHRVHDVGTLEGQLRRLILPLPEPASAGADGESTVCPRCEGSGCYQRLPGDPVKPCAVCGGHGKLFAPPPATAAPESKPAEASVREKPSKPCFHCGGTGVHYEQADRERHAAAGAKIDEAFKELGIVHPSPPHALDLSPIQTTVKCFRRLSKEGRNRCGIWAMTSEQRGVFYHGDREERQSPRYDIKELERDAQFCTPVTPEEALAELVTWPEAQKDLRAVFQRHPANPSPPLPFVAAEKRRIEGMLADVADQPYPPPAIDLSKCELVPENDTQKRKPTLAKTRGCGVAMLMELPAEGGGFHVWQVSVGEDNHLYASNADGSYVSLDEPHEKDILEILPPATTTLNLSTMQLTPNETQGKCRNGSYSTFLSREGDRWWWQGITNNRYSTGSDGRRCGLRYVYESETDVVEIVETDSTGSRQASAEGGGA